MEVDWRPFPGPQEDFCTRGEYEVLFGGAAGPGKTDCLIMEGARFAHYPDYHGIIFRRTFPQLQEIVDRCWRYYPRFGATYKTSEHRWYFQGGGRVSLSHMQHEADMYNHQGKEYQFAGFDELTQFLKTQYLYLFSRVRSPNKNIPQRIRATTNPGGIGHVWVRDRFCDIGAPGTVYIDPDTGLSRVWVRATVYDNPALLEGDPTYIKRLEALPDIEKRRLLHGDWSVFVGQAFPELSARVHGCEPFEIPPDWQRFCAFDWGFSRPYACLWFAVDFDGVIYLYRELYGCKPGETSIGLRQTNDEICEAIKAVEREKIQYRVADPACWSPTMQKNRVIGPSFQEDATKHGLFFLKADNDRIRGRQQCHQRLQVETEEKDGEPLREYPRFVAFNSCKHFWRTTTELREDEKNPEDIATDHQEDHIYDAWRYGLMSRPIIPKRKITEPQGTFAAERAKFIRAKKYAQRHGVSIQAAYGRVR